MAGLNFNATNVAPNTTFDNLPVGWYTVMMTESEMKPTSAGNGSYLECTFEVVAPAQFAGRKLWDRLNLNNPNEKAVEIAYQTLSAMCHATGIMQLQDSQQLHNQPMDAKVGMTKPTEQYPEPRNEIKGYRAAQGQANGGGAPQQGGGAPQGQQWGGQQQQGAQQNVQQQNNGQQQWGQQNNNAAQQNTQQQNNGEQQQWQNNQGNGQQVDQNQGQQQWQQNNGQQNNGGQQQQDQGNGQQPAWANQNVQQQDNTQQQQNNNVQQQNEPQQMNMQQQATDQGGQQAAQNGQAPWQQNNG